MVPSTMPQASPCVLFDPRPAEDYALAELKSDLAAVTRPSQVRGPLRRCADALFYLKMRELEAADRNLIGELDQEIPKIVARLVKDRQALALPSALRESKIVDEFDDEPDGNVEITTYVDGRLAGRDVLKWFNPVDLLEEYCPPEVVMDVRIDLAGEGVRMLISDLTEHLHARLLRIVEERGTGATIAFSRSPGDTSDNNSRKVARDRLSRTITNKVGASRVKAFLSKPTRVETITEFTGRAKCSARTLLALRNTGKASRGVWQGVAEAMGMTLKELLNDEPGSGKVPAT